MLNSQSTLLCCCLTFLVLQYTESFTSIKSQSFCVSTKNLLSKTTSIMASSDSLPDKNSEKKSWDFFRFLNTANFYGAFRPSFLKPKMSTVTDTVKPGTIIWSKAEMNSPGIVQWGPLDDVVMGGVSKSDLLPGKTFDGIWTGFVTSANNGMVLVLKSEVTTIFIITYTKYLYLYIFRLFCYCITKV